MQKPLFFALGVLFVLLCAAVLLVKQDAKSPVPDNPTFLEDIFSTEKLQSISIENADGLMFEAILEESEWQAKHLDSRPYPLDVDSLARLTQTLQQAKIIEKKSNNPNFHARLGLAPLDEDNATAHLINLGFETQSIAFLVGNQASNQEGQFFRFKDNDQMWLLDRTLSFPSSRYAWLKQVILDLDESAVSSVRRVDDEANFIIQRAMNDEESSRASWTLADTRLEDQELRYEEVLLDYVSDVLSLNFDALSHFDPLAWELANKVLTLEILASDNIQYRLEFSQEDDNSFLHITTNSEEQSFINDWRYRIPNYALERIQKTRMDFMIEKPGDAQN